MKIIAIPIAFNKERLYLNRAYIDYVTGAGMTPFLVYPNSDYKDIAKFCDGLLLSGGEDIDPTYYGFNNTDSMKCNRERDDFEREVINAFTEEKKPIFGICRGLQLLFREYLTENTLYGINFTQHIESHNAPSELEAERTQTVHSIMIEKELYESEMQSLRIFVNSMHHQAIILNKNIDRFKEYNKKKTEFEICGVTSFGAGEDKLIVEAFKIKDFRGSEVLAVQWHPEELKDYKLLINFFK